MQSFRLEYFTFVIISIFVINTFAGTSLDKAGSYLSAAMLAGYLRSTRSGDTDAPLNLINAPVLAKQAGLTVSIL